MTVYLKFSYIAECSIQLSSLRSTVDSNIIVHPQKVLNITNSTEISRW